MGRPKLNPDKRRTSLSLTLPYDLWLKAHTISGAVLSGLFEQYLKEYFASEKKEE